MSTPATHKRTGRPPMGLSQEEMRARRIKQTRDSKRRRRALRRSLATSTPLCNKWGLCINPALPSGLCLTHERQEKRKTT